MSDNHTTFESLMSYFELSEKAVKRLAKRCGVSPEPFDRELTPSERDAMYDEWLQTGNASREEMILIDTCSLLAHPGAEIYLSQKAPKLIREGRKIIIPMTVIKELQNLSSRKDDPELSQKARTTLSFLRAYKEKGIISVHGDDTDGTLADNTFQKVITMFGSSYNITVITQDYQLGQDLLAMGRMRSAGKRNVRVRKFDSNGNLLWVELEDMRR